MSDAMYLLGIDIGTTNTKVIAYTTTGKPVARFSCPTQTLEQPRGRAVYDPEHMWRAVVDGIRSVVSQLDHPDAVRGVAVTSMGESGVLLDEAGRPVFPIIAWYDPRTIPQARWWEEHFGRHEIFSITGFPVQYIASINKIMWVREHHPHVFQRARTWLCVADYIAFRLSGQAVMDHCLASRTMAFDITHRTWSKEILSTASLSPDLFPPTRPSGTPIGPLRQTVAAETGLPPDCIVATGGQDHMCGSLPSDTFGPGRLLDSTGTAEAMLLGLDRPVFSPAMCDLGFALGCHAAPESYYLIGAMQFSGGTIDWLQDVFGHDEPDESPDAAYIRLMKTAETAEPASRGLIFMPHLRGATSPPDGHARGSFVGIRPYHRRPHFLRASVEGLAHEFTRCVRQMSALSGVDVIKAAAIGGGARNEFWLQMKADISGLVLEVPDIVEATTLGAAMLAGVGSGVYEDIDAAAAVIRAAADVKTVVPDRERGTLYKQIHPVYTGLYEKLKATHETLTEIVGD